MRRGGASYAARRSELRGAAERRDEGLSGACDAEQSAATPPKTRLKRFVATLHGAPAW
jgi:hypothetical protein